MARNPPWSREELILALDLYFRVDRKLEGPQHPEVVKLSDLLNRLPAHDEGPRSGTFRNPAGVAMKLGNLRAHDPGYGGKGLPRGNKLEGQIWMEFASRPAELRAVAAAIESGIGEASREAPIDEDEEFPEGDVLSRIHRGRERNRKAVAKKKQQVLRDTGKLACEVCGFDFEAAYGRLGRGFAECHHTIPLSELTGRTTSRLQDFAVLCANCHRMIHRVRPVASVGAFRALVGRRGRSE